VYANQGFAPTGVIGVTCHPIFGFLFVDESVDTENDMHILMTRCAPYFAEKEKG